MNNTIGIDVLDSLITGVIQGVLAALTNFWYLWLTIITLALLQVIYAKKPKKLALARMIVLAILFIYCFCVTMVPYIIRHYFNH